MKNTDFTQAIFALAQDKYGISPEYLWQAHPDCAVLRHLDNGKWFAVLMRVENAKLGLQKNGKTALMNVKCAPEMLSLFRAQKGFFPAYHMNKAHWLSVQLTGEVDFDTLTFLLNTSFDLTASRQTKTQLGVERQTDWLVPANPKYYDVESALDEGEETIWKQTMSPLAITFTFMLPPLPLPFVFSAKCWR